MPGAPRRGVFLSYRRDDAGPYARLLKSELGERIPDASIFMDLDSIEPGLDFAEVIEEAVSSSAVLVASIGRQWATLTGGDGARRLDNPDDYVRFEVTTALERGVRVIPVLIDGARLLRQQELPAELHKLARLNAAKLSYDRYQEDADRLLDLIHRVLATAGEEPLAAGEREPLDRKGGEETNRHVPEEATRQAEEAASKAKETATPGTATIPSTPDAPGTGHVGTALREAAQERPAPSRSDLARIPWLLTDAERVANSITVKYSKVSALTGIAKALAATDPGHAARLLTDAEGIVNSFTEEGQKGDERQKGLVLRGTAKVPMTSHAERLAKHRESVNRHLDSLNKRRALCDVAEALAVTDPDRAERFANSITYESWKAAALRSIAEVLAALSRSGAGSGSTTPMMSP